MGNGPYRPVVAIPPNANSEQICAAVLASMPAYQRPSIVPSATLLSLYVAVWIATLVWFRHLQTKSLRLRQRNLVLVALTTVFTPVLLIVGPIRDATGRENWSCDATMWWRSMVTPSMVIPWGLRILEMAGKIGLADVLGKAKFSTLVEASGDSKTHDASSSSSKSAVQAKSLDVESMDDSQSVHSTNSMRGPTADEVLRKFRRASWRFTLLAGLITLAPFVVAAALNYVWLDYYGHGCVGCTLTVVEYLVQMLGPYVAAPLYLSSFKLMYYSPDPFGVRQELTWSCLSTGTLAMPFILLLSFDDYTGITMSGAFNFEYMVFAGCLCMHFFTVTYQIAFYYLWESNRPMLVGLDDVLSDPRALSYFRKHLVSEYSVENICFYDEVEAWKRAFPTLIPPKQTLWARRIYFTFICMRTAIAQINLPGDQFAKLEALFERHTNELVLSIDVFDPCAREIKAMMMDSFLRFTKSPFYAEMMSNKTSLHLSVPIVPHIESSRHSDHRESEQ